MGPRLPARIHKLELAEIGSYGDVLDPKSGRRCGPVRAAGVPWTNQNFTSFVFRASPKPEVVSP